MFGLKDMVLGRRDFVKQSFLTSAAFAFPDYFGGSSGSSEKGYSSLNQLYRMPEESQKHVRTWMAFGAKEEIWGKRLLRGVQKNLATLSIAISKYEPVTMLVRKNEEVLARKLIGSASVELVPCSLDDLWIRDTGPVFVASSKGERAAIDFNFNGWGKKQQFSNDAGVAAFVAGKAGVSVLSTFLVSEGGCIEVDGEGTAIMTESCTLNSNRNPGISRKKFETEMKRLLGIQKIIWLPGVRGKDITDGHTDFYARFARPGVVLVGIESDPQSFDFEVTRAHRDILRSSKDAKGRSLQVVALESPHKVRSTYPTEDFAAGYVGYYVCNGAVFVQEFGDPPRDSAARDAIKSLYPNRVVEQLNMDALAAGGGSIHCATQQEPHLWRT